MAKALECEVFLICKRKGKVGEIAELLVREVREDKYMDVRVAVCGNVDAGKRYQLFFFFLTLRSFL